MKTEHTYCGQKCHPALTNNLKLHNFLLITESGSLSYCTQHTKLYKWAKFHALIIFWKLLQLSSWTIWSRGIIFSQWLHNKKFSGLSEGIFDILISDQFRGGRNKRICSKFENFYFSTIKKSSVTILQNPSDRLQSWQFVITFLKLL